MFADIIHLFVVARLHVVKQETFGNVFIFKNSIQENGFAHYD